MNDRDKGSLLVAGLIIFICLCFGIVIYGIMTSKDNTRCEDQHQIVLTKSPYVEGDEIIAHSAVTNGFTHGGLMTNGQFTDTVCSNIEYTISFKSKDGRWIESTFYPTEKKYTFHVDNLGKPNTTLGQTPLGETRYRYHYTGNTCSHFGGDGKCSTMSGYCCEGWCGVTINKRCEDPVSSNFENYIQNVSYTFENGSYNTSNLTPNPYNCTQNETGYDPNDLVMHMTCREQI